MTMETLLLLLLLVLLLTIITTANMRPTSAPSECRLANREQTSIRIKQKPICHWLQQMFMGQQGTVEADENRLNSSCKYLQGRKQTGV